MNRGLQVTVLMLTWIWSLSPLCAELIGQSRTDDWYDLDKRYFKFEINEDGIYRISHDELLKAGFPIDQVRGNEIRLFSLGEEQMIRVSTDGLLGLGDYIEFYGLKNKGEADALIYTNANREQLNPRYSLYTDNRPYFLTWDANTQQDESPRRFAERSHGMNAGGLPPKEAVYMHRLDTVFQDFHFKPTHDGRNYIRYSNMDVGEGYGSPLKNETTLSFDLPGYVNNSLDARLQIRLATNVLSRSMTVYVNDFAIQNIPQVGFGVVDIKKTIDRQLISEPKMSIKVKGLTGTAEKHTLAFAEIWYPKRYDFGDKDFVSYLQQPSIISRLIEIENVSFGQQADVLIYNLDQGYAINALTQNGKVQFIAPASFTFDRMVLVSDTGRKTISALSEVSFDKQMLEADYLILTHPDFLDQGAQEYAAYRSSEIGGGYQVGIVDVTKIYDAYGYGLGGHVLGVKNYFADLGEKGLLPKYTFILGKGLEYSELRKNPERTSRVPTFGVPGSDNLLVAQPEQPFPDHAIGRLAASSNEEIRNYLDKIRRHENPDEKDQNIEAQRYKKSIVHLSGGSADIQALLFSYLGDMENIIANNKYGAEVTTFRKTSADPIQQTKSKEIIETIDRGAAIITFFGHSAVGTFDFSLEDPSKYQNAQKNPIILSLGCHSGNIHTAFPGVSEEFVLQKETGAIAFIASSGTAFPGPQYRIGARIYELMGGELYGKPVGDILKEVIGQQSLSSNIEEQTLAQQFTLHGDPGYQYHTFKGADFVIDYSSVKISPELLNSSTTGITLGFDVVNLGSTIDDMLDLRLIHVLPNNGKRDTINLTIPTPANRGHVEIDFDNPGPEAVGVNHFYIEVDPFNLIQEFPQDAAEKNNQLSGSTGEPGYRFFILDNSARPVFPADYSIVNSTDDLVLVSAINNALTPGGRFIVQIDTTVLFNSTLMVSTEIENEASTIEWRPKVEWTPGVVYYWRIRPIDEGSINFKNHVWRSSSFIYLPEEDHGWNQSHHDQWLANNFYKTYIGHDRQLQYDQRNWDIRIKNEIGDPSDFWVFVNNTPWASLNPRELAPAIAIFAWNEDEVIIQNSGADFGSIPHSPDGFVFKMDTPQSRKGVKDLLDHIPEGSRVFIHTILTSQEDDLKVSEWVNDKALFGYDFYDILESHGADKVRMLLENGTVPYTFIFDKGAEPVVEDIANRIEESIDLSASAQTLWDEGSMTSVTIGPSDRWMRLKWQENKEGSDESMINVYGIPPNGIPVLLKEVQNDYDVNLTGINPLKYPQLKLEYQTKDNQEKSSAQIQFWRVLYTPLPDPALYSDELEFNIADTVNAGQELNLNLELRNLSEAPAESVLIKYTLTGPDNTTSVFVRRSPPIPANGSITIQAAIPTKGFSGDYRVDIEVNPGGELREVTDCNNYGFTSVYIRPDQINPILDVTFDGRHIRNGEIVSSQPVIAISLTDDNPYVVLNDSSIFDVTLIYPGMLRWKVSPESQDAFFKPAPATGENKAELILTPNLNVTGKYTLEVQARDIAGNLSGKYKYTVSFEVDDFEKQETFRIYPNPLYAQSVIEYFQKDQRSPEVFLFRLYTPDGKSVLNLNQSDFGGIYYGPNRFMWNGTDDRGAMLPNGVYFYELITDLETKEEKIRGSVAIMRAP